MAEIQVEIYTRPLCSDCQAAKDFFSKSHIPYTEYDVTKNEKHAKQMRERTGTQITPGIIIQHSVFLGMGKKSESFTGFEQNEASIRKLVNRS